MKLILREHVEHLGERGAVVNVARGFARNYLIPKGLAWEATPGNVKQLQSQHRIWAARDAKELEEAQQLADRIAALELTVTHKAGESGTLYGSVTTAQIAELLAGHGISVERRRLSTAEPIKTVGEHAIEIRLHPKVIGRVKLQVVAEAAAD